jgi:hypothetical protein
MSKSVNQFNLDPDQLAQFNTIFKKTQKVYPELCSDPANLLRIKTLIAYSVVNDDDFTKLHEDVIVEKTIREQKTKEEDEKVVHNEEYVEK